MRAVIQRVSEASVTLENKVQSSIGRGFLILLGVEHDDHEEDAQWLCRKIADMRIFSDSDGKMNLSLKDVDGDALVVSQFTLHASTKKGNRPSFIRAAAPGHALRLYEYFTALLGETLGKGKVKEGVFGGDMNISLCNDGPVTIVMDTRNKE